MIALVITVIVLLMLSGVAISEIVGSWVLTSCPPSNCSDLESIFCQRGLGVLASKTV